MKMMWIMGMMKMLEMTVTKMIKVIRVHEDDGVMNTTRAAKTV